MAGRILKGSACDRTAKCGQKLIGPQATVCVGKGGGYVAGVETCGSVWSCAPCAARVSEKRRQDLSDCLDAHVAAGELVGPPMLGQPRGGDVFMALFTVPHVYEETCADLKAFVTKAWSKMIAGKAWQLAKDRFGIIGYVRALELTHGANGWHPHIHSLFLTAELTEEMELEMRLFVGDRWAAIVKRTTGKDVNLSVGFGFHRAANVSQAGDYVAKWGVDREMTKANQKKSRRGGNSPFQLLDNAIAGDHRARWTFREYALAMKGTRQLTWSNGLRKLYLKSPELSDEDLARMDAPFYGDLQVIAFRRFIYFKLIRAGVMPDVLSAAESAGRAGVLKLLRARGLALPEAEPYGQPDTPEGERVPN